MTVGVAEFTDFVDKDKTTMASAVETLTITASHVTFAVEHGATVAFGAYQFKA